MKPPIASHSMMTQRSSMKMKEIFAVSQYGAFMVKNASPYCQDVCHFLESSPNQVYGRHLLNKAT